MIALVFATEFELGDRHFEWEVFEGLKFTKLNDQLCIIITGAGVAKTALSLVALEKFRSLHKSIQFINIGIAGSLKDVGVSQAYMPGSFVFNTFSLVKSPTQGFVESCYPQVDLYQGPCLATSAVPVWDEGNHNHLIGLGAEIVDMEAYLFANWAKECEQEFYFIKLISDQASEESKESFKSGAIRAIESISKGLESLEALISSPKEVDLASIKKCFRVDP